MLFFMNAATNIFDTALNLILYQRVTKLCTEHRALSAGYFFTAVVLSTILNQFQAPGVICSASALVTDVVYCLILTRQAAQAIFLPTLFCLLLSFSEGVTVTLVQCIFPTGTVAVIMQTDHMLIACMIVSRLLLAAIVFLAVHFLPVDFQLSRRSWFVLCAAGIYLFVLNMLVQCNLLRTTDFPHMMPLLLAGIVIICAAFFQLGTALTKQNLEKANLEAQLQQNRQKLRQQDEMVSMYQELRGLQHDYRSHLQVLSFLAKKNNQRDLLDYIGSLSDHLYPAAQTVATGNVYIDAIVNAKCLLAQKNHVDLRLEIQMPDTLAIPPSDICTMLSNILDNGLEACMNNKQPEHRVLRFYMAQQKGFLLISSQNYTEQLPERTRFAALHSTASGGLGLHQINRLAKQYHGMCTHTLSEHVFHIELLLPHAVTYSQIFVSKNSPNPLTGSDTDDTGNH